MLVECDDVTASGAPRVRFDDAIGEVAAAPEHAKAGLGSRPIHLHIAAPDDPLVCDRDPLAFVAVGRLSTRVSSHSTVTSHGMTRPRRKQLR
jgi:hypothetical protein